MRKIATFVQLIAMLVLVLLVSPSARAQVPTPVTAKVEEAIELCRPALRMGLEINEREAEAAGFTRDAARKSWTWSQGTNIIAAKSKGFGCEVLLIGPDAQPVAVANFIAAWGAKNGFDLDHYSPALQMDVLLDGSNGGVFLELKKAPNGILVLSLSREGV